MKRFVVPWTRQSASTTPVAVVGGHAGGAHVVLAADLVVGDAGEARRVGEQPVGDLHAADVLLGHVAAEGGDGGAHGLDVELGEAPVEGDAAEAEGVALLAEGDAAVGVRGGLAGDADDAGLAGGCGRTRRSVRVRSTKGSRTSRSRRMVNSSGGIASRASAGSSFGQIQRGSRRRPKFRQACSSHEELGRGVELALADEDAQDGTRRGRSAGGRRSSGRPSPSGCRCLRGSGSGS